MIQRIQSIYLFLAGVIAAVFSFINEHTFAYLKNQDYISILPSSVALLSACIAIITIFLYKNRPLQMKLIWFSFILSLLSLGLYIYVDGIQNFYLDWEFYLVPVTMITLLLAKRGVQHDENLIKSSNRLR